MTDKNYCYIFCAADLDEEIKFYPRPGKDYIIAADGGYKHLTKLNIKPDIIVGDLDSLGNAPEGIEVLKYPVMKDDTDLMLAIYHAISAGYKDFIIYGAVGGKIDFTLANFQILSRILNMGASAYMVGCGKIVTAVKNSTLEFDQSFKGRVSVFCSGERSKGVYLKGLKYPLENAVLYYDTPLGVSNEFTGSCGSISVSDGILTVIYDDTNKKMKMANSTDSH